MFGISGFLIFSAIVIGSLYLQFPRYDELIILEPITLIPAFFTTVFGLQTMKSRIAPVVHVDIPIGYTDLPLAKEFLLSRDRGRAFFKKFQYLLELDQKDGAEGVEKYLALYSRKRNFPLFDPNAVLHEIEKLLQIVRCAKPFDGQSDVEADLAATREVLFEALGAQRNVCLAIIS